MREDRRFVFGLKSWRYFLSATLTIMVLWRPDLALAHSSQLAATRLETEELAYLRERLDREGASRPLDRRVTDALGLTSPDGPPLALRYLGLTNQSHGDAYLLASLSDGSMLLGRREWTGRISYWLLVSRDFSPEQAIFSVAEGTAPLRPEQADVELRRIVAFLRSNVPAARSSAPAR